MAGIIEYAIEQRMMKEALNAMSRKGYRKLDLAHRMIRDAEAHIKQERPGKNVRARLEKKLKDLRTDYLHPTQHSVLGDMKGRKMLYKPLHDGGVDPRLARQAQRSRAATAKMVELHHGQRGLSFLPQERKADSQVNRRLARQYSGDAGLYAPHIPGKMSGQQGYEAPSARVKGRGALEWNSSRAADRNFDNAGQVSFRQDPALSALRQQLGKVQRRASSASIYS